MKAIAISKCRDCGGYDRCLFRHYDSRGMSVPGEKCPLPDVPEESTSWGVDSEFLDAYRDSCVAFVESLRRTK